jgi:C4-dicarboxylate-specific signal transduction histidine kinase
VNHVAALQTRVPVLVIPGPDVTLLANLGQLEQMLINVLHNAAEASLGAQSSAGSESGAQVTVTWKSSEKDVVLTIEDNGPGLMNPSNAFVPFYTTKPQGSGIGLVLSRQIVEAHGGTIAVANRQV